MRRQQELAERRVGGRVGDVEQSLVGGALGQSLQLVLHASSFLSRLIPSCRLRRAASGEQPEGGGDLGVGEVGAEAEGDRRPLFRRQRLDQLPDPFAGLGIVGSRPRPARRPAAAGDRWRGGGRSPCGGRSSAASRAGCRRRGASGRRGARPGRSPGSSPRRRRGRPLRAGSPSRPRRARRSGSGTGAVGSPHRLNAAAGPGREVDDDSRTRLRPMDGVRTQSSSRPRSSPGRSPRTSGRAT